MSDAALPRALRQGDTVRAPLLPLEVEALTLTYGDAAVLDGIDLRLSGSGCTMIMGPNGAGKSLFLKVIHGLVAPTGGHVSWGGLPAAQATRRQALVFQKPVLLRRSVAANRL